MALTIKQRLDKWDKIARPRHEEDVTLFCEWFGKSKQQIIEDFYAIEKIQFLEQWKRDMGDYLYKWYQELTSGTKLKVLNRKTGKRELVYRLSQIIAELHQAKAIRSLRYVYDTYEDVYTRAIDNKMVSVAKEFCRSLDRIVRIEIEAAKVDVTPFESDMFDWNKLTEEQKIKRTFNNIMFDYFDHRRLEFLKESVKKASDHGLETIVSSLMHTYSEILDYVIELKNPKMRSYLIQQVLWNLREPYQHASDHDIQSTTFIIGMLHYKVKRMQKLGLPKGEQEFLAQSICDLALYNISKDDFGALYDLGVNGRTLVKKYPYIAIKIVETLGKSLETVSKRSEPKRVTEKMVIGELKSIRNWDRHKQKQIKERVDDILKGHKKKYPTVTKARR